MFSFDYNIPLFIMTSYDCAFHSTERSVFDPFCWAIPSLKVPSHCCDLSCNAVASCGRSGIACTWPGVVFRSHKLGIGLL